MVTFSHTSAAFLQRLCLLACFFLASTGFIFSQSVIVSGRITKPDGTPVSGTSVVASGTSNEVAVTDQDGQYLFSLEAGGSYTIQPFNNNAPLNGVSTLDMVLIAKHIDGTLPFTSPFQHVAADIDHSGDLTANDTLQLRHLILGITNGFPSNTSWRFVRSNYSWPFSMNPLNPPFPEFHSFSNLSANITNADFTAVKIGDINLNAINSGGPANTYPSKIKGKLLVDANNNCSHDAGEAPLNDWLVVASGPNGFFYGTTQPDGKYNIPVPPGDYQLDVSLPNALWDVCNSPINNVMVGQNAVVEKDFSVQVDQLCAAMEVDITTPFLRRCFESTYYVYFCNKGTSTAENARIEIDFDPFLEILGTSIPWSIQNGQHYEFELGDLESGACGYFTVQVKVSCDATLGQTHCTTAHVFPDEICQPMGAIWSGPQLQINGICQNNQVVFTVKNIGGDMTVPQEYVVIEDIMVQMSGSTVQLNSGQDDEISFPANGSTWRIEVEQAPGYPYQLPSSAWVEGCGTSGTVSQGIVNQFPVSSGAPFEDTDCRMNIGSFDPNDKQGFPLGVGPEHWIPKNVAIDYLIRFQNTGTDTAFTVIILDTLAATLDVSTLRPGASSHPYQFNIIGNGVAQFVFTQIMLPDSNTNEAASHGFVQFSIEPKKDLPEPTKIHNQAGIYFDFNAPVITNQTTHQLGSQYLSILNLEFKQNIPVSVSPNPMLTYTQFNIEDPQRIHNGFIRVFDVLGQMALEQAFQSNQFNLDASRLPAGAYYFRIDGEKGPIASGKLLKGE